MFSPFFTTALTSCDEYHTSSAGSISSPNHPDDYPPDTKCTYIIDVPDMDSVTISFQIFLLEPNFDYLYYGTGLDASISNSDGSLTGYTTPDAFTLPSTTVWLIFESDRNVGASGFLLDWVASKTVGKMDTP